MTERPPEVVLDDLAAPVFAPHIQEVFDSVGADGGRPARSCPTS